jgi:hypothetical protein
VPCHTSTFDLCARFQTYSIQGSPPDGKTGNPAVKRQKTGKIQRNSPQTNFFEKMLDRLTFSWYYIFNLWVETDGLSYLLSVLPYTSPFGGDFCFVSMFFPAALRRGR